VSGLTREIIVIFVSIKISRKYFLKMMKEFMLLIRNEGDGKASLNAEQHLAFVKKCEEYINALKNENRLIAAQPLIREGFVIL